jgi:hypothetical protein
MEKLVRRIIDLDDKIDDAYIKVGAFIFQKLKEIILKKNVKLYNHEGNKSSFYNGFQLKYLDSVFKCHSKLHIKAFKQPPSDEEKKKSERIIALEHLKVYGLL